MKSLEGTIGFDFGDFKSTSLSRFRREDCKTAANPTDFPLCLSMALNTKFEQSVFKIDPCLKSRLEQGKVTNVDGLSTVGATGTAHNEALEREISALPN